MIHLAILIVSTYVVVVTAIWAFSMIGALLQGVRWSISRRKR